MKPLYELRSEISPGSLSDHSWRELYNAPHDAGGRRVEKDPEYRAWVRELGESVFGTEPRVREVDWSK